MIPGTRHNIKNDGVLEIKSYISSTEVEVTFIATGYTLTATAGNIRRGLVKDRTHPRVFGVGYIGAGEHTTYIDRTKTPQYKTWQNMLQRCYDEKTQKRNPSYKGCTVCKHWHNFQNFAKWYIENYPEDGRPYQLDKDIKVNGNKVYSPDTCVFVTKIENVAAATAKSYQIRTPKSNRRVFVSNLAAFCRKVGLHKSAMNSVVSGRINHHKGWIRA